MVDVGTGLALLGSAKLLEKLLGPTADYIGGGVKTFAEKRINNIRNIFSVAARKLGDRIEANGTVPPRVLKGILDEGSFFDDFLAAEYFGGVLASSRSGVPRDDRGATFIQLVSRLSTYQIRSHYVFSHMIKKLFDGADINIGSPQGRRSMETYVPLDVYVSAMDFDEQEQRNVHNMVSHVMFGLAKEHLIEIGFRFAIGDLDYLRQVFPKVPAPGIIFSPSALGVELLLWAHGRSDLHITDFLEAKNQFDVDARIEIRAGYQKTKQ